jgi:HAD superfamily hydrolase (TIGR01490 family)
MTGRTTTAAFFDLDKTLIPGSSLFLLARGLYDHDFYRVGDLLRFGWEQAKFRTFGSESPESITRAREGALRFIRGHAASELREWGQEIVDERILPRVYPGIADVIAAHHAAGQPTFLVTAAPRDLAEMVAAGLRMAGALGTRANVDAEGRYTGELVGDILHGPAKAEAVAALAAQRGIDLSGSSAYSDSINDLPLLELVGDPRAVNPDRKLRAVARTRGWPVHELRARRRALLVGVPSVVGAMGLFLSGIALGLAIARRQRTPR